ncbi:hypothetical protein [Vreelandella glaciei]|uniref:hypothetical protein n=1 Tax=Vreelandella glaciei TaxID=186761 RepID=UPI00300322FA
MSKPIWVFADWLATQPPELIGRLEVDLVRGSEVYRFAYAKIWLDSPLAMQIDPELQLFSGDQFNNDARHFRVFLD